ncbi:YhgE/Pip domain-containing protein [Kroppenstedtia eburnea]|uniref:Putative membrane protein n=1 Tax=Kroppenstedtia eburnea TaxID=714067 RepID=A0A1N7JGN3_9BACL|nr:YhgE/Pip domain-containing protein [Kroppenstedtia eburnea]EGK10188.1 YhgE/Pip domain protein [Desmospora sp. 8437]QKI80550.1 YhgE/Pip domain-containing protein [Kroppenstedtia eburnea]SIS48542.1 putative membrane protein [Kroppenstedtia eburnea]
MGLLRKRRETTLALNEMIWKERKLIVVILGILCIPLLYSGIYLTAFFDPYDQMENLSVAVVNEDRGAKNDGEHVNVGKELVERLQDDDQFGWKFVNRTEMEEGLEKGRYHLAVVIPEDFSRHATSLQDPKPLKGKLEYRVNEGANYLSSQIGQRMIDGLQDNVKEKLIHAYAEALFDEVEESADQLDEASEGASELAGATGKAKNATGRLEEGAIQLASGVHQLDQAIGRLAAGVGELVKGLNTAETGAEQLQSGAGKLDNGLGQLESGIEKGMKDLPRLKEGAEQIRDGIGKFKDIIHNPKLERGAGAISEIARKLQGHSSEADRRYEQMIQKHPELADDPDVVQLKKALDNNRREHASLLDRAARLEQDLKQAQNSIDRMYGGQTQVVDGIGAIQKGMDQQLKGVKELHSGASLLSTKLGELKEGLDKLVAGGKQLDQGVGQLALAPGKLSDGLVKLSAGLKELSQGLGKISDGQNTLADKLAEGVDAAREALEGKGLKADQMADPVQVDKDRVHQVPNYATGFAPYFISLSLWVGAMIFFTVMDLKRPLLGNDTRPFSGLSALLMGTLQALLLILVLIHFVGIEPVHEGWLYLFAVITGIVFTSINHFLVSAFKDVGRFIAILLLMFQLTSSSGTYTVDLLPSFFQGISPFLPMTYSIEGLRAVISTGDTAVIMEKAQILLGIGIAAWLLRKLAEWLWRTLPGKLKSKAAVDNG